MSQKRRKILGLINNKEKQFSYGLLNVFFALFLILAINTIYLYKFTQIPDLCTDAGGVLNPTGIVHHLNLMIAGSLLAVLMAGGLCFVFVIFLTHRFFGPMVPIARHVDELSKGNFSNRLRLRKKDEMHELGEKLNQLAAELEKNYVRR